MVQSQIRGLANMKDVPNMPLREEYVSDMVQRERLAVMKDAPTKFRREEFV